MRVKLEDVCERGTSSLMQKDIVDKNGKYPVYGASGRIGSMETYQQEHQTVAVVKDGAGIGRTMLLPEKSSVIGTMQYLIPKNCIESEYLYYVVKYMHLEKYFSGATIPHIYFRDYKTEEFNLHDKTEQREIVSTLKRIEAIISNRQEQLTKLDELIKARFVEMFGDVISNSNLWPICKFSEITSSRLGKMLDAKQQTGVHRYPYLANFNVQWFRFELKTLNSMDFNEPDRIEFELHDGDLLVCEGGEIGRCAVWHNNVQPCYFQKALHRVRCNKDFILPDFLAWWFKYNCDHGGFSAIEGAKATIAHLPGAKLKNLDVCVPPLSLQNQFADFVAEADKSKLLAELFAQSTCILAENRSK